MPSLLCFIALPLQIVTRGMYSITAMYNSRFRGPRPQFILAVGEWKDIVAGTAPSLTNTLGHKVRLKCTRSWLECLLPVR